MFSMGLIRESDSVYSSPLVIGRKREKSIGLCVSYANISEKIVNDIYPAPLLDAIWARAAGAKHISAIDIRCAWSGLTNILCVPSFVKPGFCAK